MAHIMVVDDSTENNMLIRHILERFNHSVVTFTDARDALAYLSANTVDFIITDLMMPNMDGLAFTEAVRLNYSLEELPIMFLTAVQAKKDEYAAFEAGANAYMTKPIDVRLMLKKIDHLLSGLAV